ncbi:hypothetical protein BRSU_1179 [Brachyspira suanatina]|uniref:CopG-like ribbon-helix-helix domain-containing protein n=1 Tax=Brachyspira suanatina TaxID=381802 RepID=A0A0G4K6J9_9SPIR|nr:hypothetical protein [Brachyspira suanatina]CRF33032.1 hypothetical protein BRSU_1179 [Brachyspira suanatina]
MSNDTRLKPSLNLSSDEISLINKIAQEQARTKNSLITYIVKEYLKEYQEKQAKEKGEL